MALPAQQPRPAASAEAPSCARRAAAEAAASCLSTVEAAAPCRRWAAAEADCRHAPRNREAAAELVAPQEPRREAAAAWDATGAKPPATRRGRPEYRRRPGARWRAALPRPRPSAVA